MSIVDIRNWFGSTSGVPYKAYAGQLGVPGGISAAGMKGVLEAAVDPVYHPIGLGVVGGGWLVLNL